MSRENDHVEVFRGTDGAFYWRRVAANGKELSRSSEGYYVQGRAVEIAGELNPGVPIDVEGQPAMPETE